MDEKAEIERLREQEDVKTALKQTIGTKESAARPVAQLQDKLWFGTYLLLLLGLIAFRYLLDLDLFPIPDRYLETLQRLLIAAMLVVIILAVAKSIRVYLIGQIESTPDRYDLSRVLNLVMALAIVLIGLSILSATWYAALVSLGIISLILGFALQTPITSFNGWIYLLIRRPCRVGDRIKIGEAKGDVIDVRYLVHPKESGRVKTSLTKNLLLKLNAESERVLFPRSNLR